MISETRLLYCFSQDTHIQRLAFTNADELWVTCLNSKACKGKIELKLNLQFALSAMDNREESVESTIHW